MLISNLSAAFSVLAITCLTWFLTARKGSKYPLPPGPRRLPIFGNFFSRPVRDLHLWYADQSAKYGEIMSLTVLGHTIIVINSARVAKELLEKRSKSYSDRPGNALQ